jgi:PAS domain-containing protein
MSASLLGYLQSMASELAHMARDGGYGTLAYIYEMAVIEASPARLWQVSPAGVQRQFVGLWDWDGINERMYFDEATAKCYGIDPELAANGMPSGTFRARIYADDAERVHAAAVQALESTGNFGAEFRIVDAEGCLRWIYQQGRVQRDAEGRAVRFNGVTFDITAEKCLLSEASLH